MKKMKIPIAFMIVILKYAKLNYTMVEKYSFAIIKDLEYFNPIFGSNLVNI